MYSCVLSISLCPSHRVINNWDDLPDSVVMVKKQFDFFLSKDKDFNMKKNRKEDNVK